MITNILLPLATAADVHEKERILFLVLAQLILILLAARAAGSIAKKFGQPRVVGEIIGGIVLGPSLFGQLAPGVFAAIFRSAPDLPLVVMSQIGLILLMFQIGMEFDFSHLRETENKRAVILVSAVGIACPLVLGWFVAAWSHPHLAPGVNPLGYGLFMATALSITAIPILGRIMIEFGLTRTRVGAVAITSAAINDVTGWILLAVVSTIVAASFTTAAVLVQLSLLAGFLALSWLVVRPLLRRFIDSQKVTPTHLPPLVLAVMISAVFAAGMCTFKIGIFAIFGGFIMGILLFDRRDFVEAWHHRMNDVITVFFLPIFFTFTGLRTNIGSLNTPTLWFWCGAIIAAATIGKFAGCYLAARIAGIPKPEAGCLGIMMNTRALMELIVINIGKELGVIPDAVFTMLVLMAIFTTLITSPLLRVWLPRMGHRIPEHREGAV